MSDLGDRVKRYENAYKPRLTPRSCLFIRVDGKSFHTYTRGMNRPFDATFVEAMAVAAEKTAHEMMGFKGAYVQSDECTFMLTDFDKHETESWFDYELNKIVSISASTMTAYFNQYMGVENVGVFDSRAFIVPMDDAPNVFVWRQQDWHRNSVQMLAQASYSQKELDRKKISDLHEMIHAKGGNWAKLAPIYKNGTFFFRDFERVHEKLQYEELYDELFRGIEV